MLAFETYEMIAHISHLPTILTINITRGGRICRRHGLHADGRVKKREVFRHILGALLAQRTGVVTPAHVHGETVEMHDMTALQSSEGFRALEHGFVADGTIRLQSLWNAVMFIRQ